VGGIYPCSFFISRDFGFCAAYSAIYLCRRLLPHGVGDMAVNINRLVFSD